MDEHLQRALIEVCYAIADFNQNPDADQCDETRVRLLIIKAGLEELVYPGRLVELLARTQKPSENYSNDNLA